MRFSFRPVGSTLVILALATGCLMAPAVSASATVPSLQSLSTLASDPALSIMNAAEDHTLGSSMRAAGSPRTALPASVAASIAAPGMQGLDVSAWQGDVDWGQVWTNGGRFAYVKATEGTTYVSSRFAQQYNGSAAVGMIRGAYHFAVPNASSGAAQANYFVSNGGGWHPDGVTLPPLLDIEYNPYGTDACYGFSAAQMVAWISDFSNTVLARTGRAPAIYTTTDWWTRCAGNSGSFSNNPLFIARYPANISSGAGTMPSSWSTYSIWQYASSGGFPGDQDVFNGSYIALQNFAGTINPFSSLDGVDSEPGAVHVKGWAFDPNTNDPISVHVYVNGVATAYLADTSRPDLPPIFGDIGSNHGFDLIVPTAATGRLTVCVYAINVGPGINMLIGACRDTQPVSGSPFGSVDFAGSSPGQIDVTGWALDPDTTVSIPVHVYVDAAGEEIRADSPRPDVGAASPLYGADHGFATTVSAAPGQHRVCAYGINTGQGANALIACASVVVPGGSPIGYLDSVTAARRSVTVSGWSLDPDTASPVTVDIRIDGVDTPLLASAERGDVGAAFPKYGSSHGYSSTISAAVGTHSLCAYAVNIGAGSDAVLGCRTIVVLGDAPVGSLDAVSASGGSVTVSGWAIDPSTTSPASIQVTVDSVATRVSADQPRQDVGEAFPAYGPGHGFSGSVPIAVGIHQVCAVALASGSGGNLDLGCRTVTF